MKRQQVTSTARMAWNMLSDKELSEADMRAVVNAGAFELVQQTIDAGAKPEAAMKWWLGELSRRAHESGAELADVGVTPAQVARVAQLEESGALNDKLARQVLDGVLAGQGTPDEIVAARGLAVVSDDRALTVVVDEVIAAHPDIAAKIREGKTAAAAALVGA